MFDIRTPPVNVLLSQLYFIPNLLKLQAKKVKKVTKITEKYLSNKKLDGIISVYQRKYQKRFLSFATFCNTV